MGSGSSFWVVKPGERRTNSVFLRSATTLCLSGFPPLSRRQIASTAGMKGRCRLRCCCWALSALWESVCACVKGGKLCCAEVPGGRRWPIRLLAGGGLTLPSSRLRGCSCLGVFCSAPFYLGLVWWWWWCCSQWWPPAQRVPPPAEKPPVLFGLIRRRA